jgi:hypothetical protein
MGTPQDTSTWDHVNPFQEDNGGEDTQYGETAENHLTSDEPRERSGSLSSSSAKQDDKGSTLHTSPSQDATSVRIESSESHDEGVLEKVKTAANEAKFQLQQMRATGPSKRFNPTNVRMHVRFKGSEDGHAEPTLGKPPRGQSDFNVLWRSRDNRKGRGSIAVPRMASLEQHDSHIHIGSTIASFKQISKGIWKMCTTFPYWNLAFWSGWAYAWGSVLFIISATWAWYPVAYPDREYNEGLETYGVPLTTFFG